MGFGHTNSQFFSKEKTRVFPYFMRVCELIYHDIAYISCPIHMVFSFEAFGGF
jgi:hypothetical protein